MIRKARIREIALAIISGLSLSRFQQNRRTTRPLMWPILAIVAALLVLPFPAFADKADDCKKSTDNDIVIRACTDVIRTDPQNSESYLRNRANAYKNKGELDRAIADYTTLIAKDDDEEDYYVARGRLYRTKGDYDRAIADYTAAIKIDSQQESIYVGRGLIFELRGEIDRAIADYTSAITIVSSPTTLRHRGFASFGKGDYKNAISDLSAAIEKGPDMEATLFRYIARTRVGEDGKADLESAATKNIRVSTFRLIMLLLGKSSLEAVLAEANTDDMKCTAHAIIGQWYLLEKKQAEAITAFQAAVSTCPKINVHYITSAHELRRLREKKGANNVAVLVPSVQPVGPSVQSDWLRSVGLGVAEITDALRKRYKIEDSVKAGIVITSVAESSSAGAKSLRVGDVIVEVAQDLVANTNELQRKVEEQRKTGKKSVLILLNDNKGMSRFVALSLQ